MWPLARSVVQIAIITDILAASVPAMNQVLSADIVLDAGELIAETRFRGRSIP
jgi:hypothetical protein